MTSMTAIPVRTSPGRHARSIGGQLLRSTRRDRRRPRRARRSPEPTATRRRDSVDWLERETIEFPSRHSRSETLPANRPIEPDHSGRRRRHSGLHRAHWNDGRGSAILRQRHRRTGRRPGGHPTRRLQPAQQLDSAVAGQEAFRCGWGRCRFGVLLNITTVDDEANVVISGWPPDSFMWSNLRLVAGHVPGASEPRAAMSRRVHREGSRQEARRHASSSNSSPTPSSGSLPSTRCLTRILPLFHWLAFRKCSGAKATSLFSRCA